MKGKLCIYICNSLVPEVSQILRNGDYPDVVLKSFPSVCNGCHYNNKKLLELVAKDEGKYSKIIVIASCCKGKSVSNQESKSKIEIVQLEQCFEILFPLETIYHFAKDGNYLISNGWLRNYKRHIREWGFNDISSKAFFGESMKQLLLLDTGLPGEYESKIKALSEYTGLKYSILPIGNSFLYKYIENLVSKWRREKERVSTNERITEITRETADYKLVFHYLQKLVDNIEEEIIVTEIFKLLEILFAPEQIIYEPIGVPLKPITYRPEKAIENYNSDRSFEIKIVHSKESIGTFGIKGVMFPEYIPKYKEMTDIMSHMAGLAISNARKYSQIENAKSLISKSELLFRTMFNEAPMGVALIDSYSGHISEANPQFAKIIGRRVDELSDLNWMQITHPDDIKEDLDNMALLNAGKISGFQMEKRYLHTNKSWVWINMKIASLKIAEKDNPQHLCMIDDITERKKADTILLESEAKFKNLSYQLEAIIDHIPGLLFYKDTENNFIRVNKYVAESYNKSKKELEGKNLKELHPEKDAEKYFQDDLEVINTGIPKLNIEELFETLEGDKWLSTSKIPFRNDKGELIGIIGISVDVTDRKNYEAKILEKNKKLKTAIAEKDKFFSIISHDIRSPLASLVSLLELMSINFYDFPAEEIHRFINTTYKTSQSLFQLLENLLEWSRMQLGVMPFKPEIIDLDTFIGECEPSTYEMAKKKKIRLKIDVPKGIFVFADSNMLHSTIRNLVTNAIKFTREGGLVELKAVNTDNGNVKISVSDNGIGMSEELMNKLFHTDSNVSRPGTNNEHSSGLGLLLCKEFVEKHGGTIGVESKVNEGSCFCFNLPGKGSFPKQ